MICFSCKRLRFVLIENEQLIYHFLVDSLNRIGSVSEQQQSAAGAWAPSVSQTFAYDRYGNKRIPSQTGGVNGYNPTYNTANNRINGLTYDAAGNITQDALTGGTMTYDAENRLLTATNGGGGSYTYEGEGRQARHCRTDVVVRLRDQRRTAGRVSVRSADYGQERVRIPGRAASGSLGQRQSKVEHVECDGPASLWQSGIPINGHRTIKATPGRRTPYGI
ncbi:MAG: hypothetical protein AB7H86_01295 [Blastocatellales bacterium]